MLPRVMLTCATLFWVTMNVLLWRAEYGNHATTGSAIPAHVVWEKILTAPDSSSLTILHNGKKIGFCHWLTSIGEDLSKMKPDDAAPEGMVERVTNYRVQLEGNVAIEGLTERLRFDSHLTLSPNHQWQDFSLRLNLRPSTWEVRTSAAEKTLRVISQDDGARSERVYKFSELQNPQTWLPELAGPFAVTLLSAFPIPSNTSSNALSIPKINWEARHTSVRIGRSPVPAYRLSAKLLDRYQTIIFVSRVGEILRAELPAGIVLINDQLGAF